MLFLILPHQLFDIKYLNKNNKYLIYEHPHYFKSYNYNKKKLMLHRASMKYYYDYLKKHKYNVIYKTYTQKLNSKTHYTLFDPIDHIKLPKKCKILETPNFLLTRKDYKKYHAKTDKFFFNNFYKFSKKLLNIIPNTKSKDKQNRKKMPQNTKIPKLPTLDNIDMKYIKEAKKYVEKNFPKNCGNIDNFNYPITHNSAKKWMRYFVKNKLKHFGDYQDFIDKNNNYLFHSVLSTSINIGLLNPQDIIKYVLKNINKYKIKVNNYEGYIRQLFWREYQRYCYIYFDFSNKNYFGNKKKLSDKWYNGTLNIKPLDDAIKNAFNTGYLHHILRLMVIGNYMNLSGINPKEGFKWFMEFSCDSYEWVMYQNVYEMVFFISGGATMRKPYISSSNYILKMSNYKKDKWCDEWDKLYHKFIKKNKRKMSKFKYYYKSI